MIRRLLMQRTVIATILVGVCVLGAALRLARLDEMEYKGDEQWMYTRAINIPSTEPWPLLGMPSSVGLPNPALSVLLFVGLAKIGVVCSPVQLDTRVVALNVAGLALAFVFATWLVASSERAAWQWGVALFAVSPLAIVLERKIWAQSALPLFSMLFLIGWWYRDRRWGALLWGAIAACLGQIHMSGFFFAGGFLIWERYAGRLRTTGPSTRWPWAMAGLLIGGIGVGFWIASLVRSMLAAVMATHHATGGPMLATFMDWHVLTLWPSFWVNWAFDATGLGLDYSLGSHYVEFLKGPVVFGRFTWIALAASLASAGIGISIAGPWAYDVVRDLRERRMPARFRRCTETVFTEGAALGGFGALLTATVFLKMNRFYLIVAYPLQWVWLSRLTLRRRSGHAILAALWVTQLAISVSYLQYIHEHRGAEGADYGRAYRWQSSTAVTCRP